jgi:hypothetical protein
VSVHQPFTVAARLQQGAALDARFGTALDGILASQIRQRAKRALGGDGGPVPGSVLDGGQHIDAPVEIDLPLDRCPVDPWHWLATTAAPVDHTGAPVTGLVDVHHLHNRHPHRISEVVARKLPTHVSMTAGRFRARRLPVITTPAAALTWRGVGDVAVIADLLTPLSTVGARRGGGEGTVLAWTVTAHPDGDPDAFGHLHADGTLGRPAPEECTARLSVDGPRGTAGIRPPYWHRSRQHILVLPDFTTEAAHGQH